MVLCWLASLQAIALTYNHFVLYPPTGAAVVLPAVTAVALSLRGYAVCLPAVWGGLSVLVYVIVRNRPVADRNEFLLAFTLLTFVVGLAMVLFFNLGSILPAYRIGTTVR